MAHKNRKTQKKRGSRTHGYGNTQKHRGAGSRGGRGMAGSKKHKWTYVSKYLPDYFGRSGFRRPSCQVKEKSAVNIGYLSQNADKLVENGFLRKEKDAYVVNLSDKGVGKLLGAGPVAKKFIVEVGECSQKAKQKIEAAGGQVTLTAAEEEPTEKAGAETTEAG